MLVVMEATGLFVTNGGEHEEREWLWYQLHCLRRRRHMPSLRKISREKEKGLG